MAEPFLRANHGATLYIGARPAFDIDDVPVAPRTPPSNAPAARDRRSPMPYNACL